MKYHDVRVAVSAIALTLGGCGREAPSAPVSEQKATLERPTVLPARAPSWTDARRAAESAVHDAVTRILPALGADGAPDAEGLRSSLRLLAAALASDDPSLPLSVAAGGKATAAELRAGHTDDFEVLLYVDVISLAIDRVAALDPVAGPPAR